MKKNIIVTAKAAFDNMQSDALHHKFVWSYDITIENNSNEIVQLLNREWLITDVSGKIEEIHGVGVVGLQPLLKPGKTFNYTSYCQLSTPQGTMEGHYEMQDLNDVHFTVAIPKFVLQAPNIINPRYRTSLH
ncbi:MAG: Co2+/Mg2+ efflux protein ApaG [Gammaproteobacteria bacterium]